VAFSILFSTPVGYLSGLFNSEWKEVKVMWPALVKGQGLVEYALIMVLVVVIVVVVLALIGPKVGQMFSNVIPML
jgi:pilus assembly protein Flp/PilA